MRILLILLFLCLSAQAQVPPPKQWPIVGETRDFVTGKHGTDDAGHRWTGYRYLDDNGFSWLTFVGVLRRDKVLQLSAPLAGESQTDYAARMWAANSPLPCSDTAIRSICDTARAEMAKVPLPDPPRFVVAKNGTTLTRPVYRLDLTTRTVGEIIAGLRAPVGAECACWASGVRKNGTAYCTWVSEAKDTRADQVTMCRGPV